MTKQTWFKPSANERPKREAPTDEAKDIKLSVKAEADVAESERRITRQQSIIEELRAQSGDTGEADKALVRLQASLVEHQDARDAILKRIADAKDA